MEDTLLYFHIRVMSVLGLWAKGSRSFLDKIHTFANFFMQLLNLISSMTNLIQCSGKLNCIFENVTYTILILTSMYTFSVYLLNETLYQAAAITLRELMEEFRTREYTIKMEKFTRRVAWFFTTYCIMGLLQYNIAPFFDYKDCVKRNSKDSAWTCGLPTPGWFPFDCTTSPGYEVAYAIQCISAILCIASVSQPILLISSIIYHIIAHLNKIQYDLKSISDEKAEKRQKCNLLRNLIRHHAAVLDFSNIISDAFNQLMFMYAFLMAIIFSVVGFQIIQMLNTTIELWNLWRYIFVFIGWYITLLILSIVGQKLIDESTAVAESAYNTTWYDEPIEFQKMIQLLILRAQRPLVLRSASISDVSFPSFSKMMSTTYSYLTMMYNTLLDDQENEVKMA